jgi:hypothetical protein
LRVVQKLVGADGGKFFGWHRFVLPRLIVSDYLEQVKFWKSSNVVLGAACCAPTYYKCSVKNSTDLWPPQA